MNNYRQNYKNDKIRRLIKKQKTVKKKKKKERKKERKRKEKKKNQTEILELKDSIIELKIQRKASSKLYHGNQRISKLEDIPFEIIVRKTKRKYSEQNTQQIWDTTSNIYIYLRIPVGRKKERKEQKAYSKK